MSWNTLEIAGMLGINRVVLASSVNAIGMSESFFLSVWGDLRRRDDQSQGTRSRMIYF
jgi:hypothetical protein